MEEESELDLTKIKIKIVQNSSGSMRAQVELNIGVIKIIGYRIFEFSSGQYEVYPPQVPNSYKKDVLDIVRITHKPTWQKIKSMVIEEYQNKVKNTEENTKNVEKNENIDPEEIPF